MKKIKEFKRIENEKPKEKYLTERDIIALISNRLKFCKDDITLHGGSIKSSNYVYGGKGFKINNNITEFNKLEGLPASSLGWTNTLTFSAVDYNTVQWNGGAITLSTNSGGRVFNIVAGNTGDMSTKTYIYLDLDVSETILQTTTNSITANGGNKINVAVAYNNPDTASLATYQVFGGSGGATIMTDNLVANSAVTNEFVSNTSNVRDGVITNAKITNLDVDKLVGVDIVGKNIVGGEFRSIAGGTSPVGKIWFNTGNDLMLQGKDNVIIVAGGTSRVDIGTIAFHPSANETYNLGQDGNRWKNVHALKYYADGHGGDTCTFNDGDGNVITITGGLVTGH